MQSLKPPVLSLTVTGAVDKLVCLGATGPNQVGPEVAVRVCAEGRLWHSLLPPSALCLEAASWGLEDEGGAAQRVQEPWRMPTEATAVGRQQLTWGPVGCFWGKGTLRLLRASACRISRSCYDSVCMLKAQEVL